MPKSEPEFMFRSEDESFGANVRVGVPANISDKQALLGLIAKDLSLPGYFGENWDAFEECLRDLSWLSAGEIVLDHEDVPLADDVANAKTYVAILADATRKMGRTDRPLVVKFPVAFRDQISSLLRL